MDLGFGIGLARGSSISNDVSGVEFWIGWVLVLFVKKEILGGSRVEVVKYMCVCMFIMSLVCGYFNRRKWEK